MTKQPRKKRVIIFDLSEVLLTGIKDTGIKLAEKHHMKFEAPMEYFADATPLLVPMVREYFNGNVSEDDYLDDVLRLYPNLGTREWLKEHIRENFIELEGTRDIILRLKALGYTLALLSVHSQEWVEYCESKFKYHDMFDFISYSYQTKVSKPDHQSFQYILNELKVEPAECVFIDDSQANVQSAQKLGIESIVFTTAEDLHQKLETILPDYKQKRLAKLISKSSRLFNFKRNFLKHLVRR